MKLALFYPIINGPLCILVLQRIQLLHLGVAEVFMRVCSDEGSGSILRYQSQDLSKLHAVISILIRTCDISSKEQSWETAVYYLANRFAVIFAQYICIAIR